MRVLFLHSSKYFPRNASKRAGRRFWTVSLSLAIIFQSLICLSSPCIGAEDSSQDKAIPSGTLLLPLTPKLDLGRPFHTANPVNDGDKRLDADLVFDQPVTKTDTAKAAGDVDELLPSLETMSAEKGKVENQAQGDNETINEDTTLKGTIQIVADDTEYDQDKNTFLGTGNAIAVIGGQNSKLEADTILYDQNNQTIDAHGNVRILRNGQLTTGSAFKFKVNSDEYLITQPDTDLQGSQIISRKAVGTKEGLAFHSGTMTMPVPFYLSKNVNNGPISYREQDPQVRFHTNGYLPEHPSFRFRAKKMVYERYKEQGNLTVFGGRIEMGDFSIPIGKFVCTVGQTETKTVFPITPYLGNNLQVGGMNLGPQFNTGIGKDTVLSWSPLLQMGGRNLSTGSNVSGLGLGAKIGLDSKNFSAHLGYGTTTNFLVGDVKAKVWRNIRFQAGTNRFLDDGMFGLTRARYLAELKAVNQYVDIPGIGLLQFRSSAGWAQDNPQLVNISSNYAQLHGSPTSTLIRSAFRVQEQLTVVSHPLFNIGTDKWGAKSFLYGGAAARGYSTCYANLVGQTGPILDVHLDRLRLQTGYNVAAVRGSSPFVFDEFIQGSQSTYLMGDVKVNKYLTLGTLLGYNMTQKLCYSKQLQAAIGPSDLKLVVGKDFVMNNYRVGFNVIHGEPVSFDNLVLKGNPDQGQLGGI